MSKADEPAFPGCTEKLLLNEVDYEVEWTGLSKREYFSGLAMQGLLSNPRVLLLSVEETAIQLADSILDELDNPCTRNSSGPKVHGLTPSKIAQLINFYKAQTGKDPEKEEI